MFSSCRNLTEPPTTTVTVPTTTSAGAVGVLSPFVAPPTITSSTLRASSPPEAQLSQAERPAAAASSAVSEMPADTVKVVVSTVTALTQVALSHGEDS